MQGYAACRLAFIFNRIIIKINMQKIYLLFIVICFISCRQQAKKENEHEFVMYSTAVKDSFFMLVQLPDNYQPNGKATYPVVYMLDANFHFPMLAATIKQYEKGRLLPPLILVGIGYRNFQQMDSLRNRDYLYPAALPSDEISTSGDAKNFHAFITQQLVPYIDSNYRTIVTNRSLLGHSFGGYFSLFSLLLQAENKQPVFKNIVAASPSLWYNNFYLNQLPGKLKAAGGKDSVNLFITAGGLEDSAWTILPVKKFADSLQGIKNLTTSAGIYSNLGHMDMATITFIKALQEFYRIPE